MTFKKNLLRNKIQNELLLAQLMEQQRESHFYLNSLLPDYFSALPAFKLKLLYEKHYRTYGQYHLDNVLRSLERLEAQQGTLSKETYETKRQELQKKLENICVKKLMKACFLEDCIYFFVPAIEQFARQHSLELEAYYQELMVHELFHAYHCHCVVNRGNTWNVAEDQSFKANAVKESLASYVQYCWLETQGREKNRQLLRENACGPYMQPAVYPYSGLKEFLKLNREQAQVLFRRVFEASLASWEEGYTMLIAP